MSNNFDSNVSASIISGTLTLELSAIVQKLIKMIDTSSTNQLATVISFKNLKLEISNFYVPSINAGKFFDLGYFNKNFLQAFGTTFPAEAVSKLIFGVKIIIQNNLPFASFDQLDEEELPAFRFLTCLLMGLAFNISIVSCACFPADLGELKATQANLGINCFKLECKNQLKLNPLLYDELLHTNCTDTVVQAAIVTLDVFAGKNVNLNIALTQIAESSGGRGARDYIEEEPPIGSILHSSFEITSNPNFIICDGRSLDRATFPDLFRSIGFKYTQPNVVTRNIFHIPKLEDKSIRVY